MSYLLSVLLPDVILSVLLILVFIVVARQLTLFNNYKQRILKEKVNTSREYNRKKLHDEHDSKLDEIQTKQEGDEFLVDPQVVSSMSYFEKSLREGVASSVVFFMELIRNLYVSLISLVFYGFRRRNLFEIYRKFGREKAIYLNFQIHLLWISFLGSILVCAVLLPLHLTGREIDNSKYENNIVALTNVIRIAISPVKMIAHIALFIIFILITLIFMISFHKSRFSSSLLLVNEESSNGTEQNSAISLSNDENVIISPFTIVLNGIPKEASQKSVQDFIQENFNGGLPIDDESSKIVKIFHVPNLVDRLNLKELEEHLERELEHFTYLKSKSNYDTTKRHIVQERRPLFSDDLRFKLCGCTTYSANIKTMTTDEALEYLKVEYADCKRMVEQWDGEYSSMFLTTDNVQTEEDLSQIKQVKSSGKCFIVFKKVEFSNEAIEKNRIMFNDSSVSLMKLLIEPQDINWHFIDSGNSKFFSLRNFCMISLIFFVLLIFSGPPSILQSLQTLGSPILESVNLGGVSDLIFHYFPSLLIFIFSKLFPIFFKKITQTEKHISKSFYSRLLLVRLFTFSILNMLILPGLWIISVFLFLAFSSEKHFDVMFLPSTVETMISTLLQFMVMENVYELVRFGKTLYYIWKTKLNCYRKARTPTQMLQLIKEIKEFDMEENISNMLGIFCLSMVYSFCCPLVMPLAFLCFFIKHWFDRCVIAEEFAHHSNIHEADNKLDFTSSLRLSKLLIILVFTSLTIVGIIFVLGFTYLLIASPFFIIHLGVCGACLGVLIMITLVLIFKQKSSLRSSKKDIGEQQERILDSTSFSQRVNDILNVENILKFY